MTQGPWPLKPLVDVVEVLDSRRVPVKAADRAASGGDVPYYGATGQVGFIDRPLFNEPLLLLGEDGVPFLDPNRPKAYLIDGPAWVNNHAHVLRTSEQVDRRFLLYCLNTFDYRGFVNGTTRLKLTQTAMRSMTIPFPDMREQRRIVEIVEDHLSHLDAADASLALAGQRAVALGASVREDSIAGSFFPLGEIAAIQGGIQKQPKRAPKENSFPFLRVANVTGDGLNLDEVHQVELFDDEIERWRLAAGDLLVVEGNGSAAQIGRSCLWDGSIPECVHQNHIIRVRPRSSMIPEYLELVWNSPSLRAELTRIASSSSGLHTLSVAKLKRLVVPRPPLEIQQQLIGEAQRVLEDAKRLRAMVAVLQQRSLATRRGVLAAAFSGRLTGASVDSEVIEELAQG